MVKVVRIWDRGEESPEGGWTADGAPKVFDQPAITAQETINNGRGRYSLQEPAGWPPSPRSAAPAPGQGSVARSALAGVAPVPLSQEAADTLQVDADVTLVPARPGSSPSLGDNPIDPRDTVADVVARDDERERRKHLDTDGDGDGDIEDPFRDIPGVGPKISRKLRFAGITTLEQLAGSDATRLSTIAATPGKSAKVIAEQDWPGRARALLENRDYTGPTVETGVKAETADLARDGDVVQDAVDPAPDTVDGDPKIVDPPTE